MPGTATRRPGTLILIGGREDKDGDRVILTEVARRAGRGTLVVATLASVEPDLQWERYARVFRALGIDRISHLAIADRQEATNAANLALLEKATAVFFTGGDQMKITAKLGGTVLHARLRELYAGGALIAGTSAGAAAMGDVMLVSESSIEDSHKVGGAFFMVHGLGLAHDLIIDQHFAQRARIERLVGAVAENPADLALGIDEDTAVVLDSPEAFHVIGAGAVYVADGHTVTHTNASERAVGRTLSIFDLRLHVLNRQTGFDIAARRPLVRPGSPEVEAPAKTATRRAVRNSPGDATRTVTKKQ
jgi:cyanophycinase